MKLVEIVEKNMADRESYILGKVLTIIDAAISDPEQRKGLKDLIRNTAYSGENWQIHHVRQAIGQFGEKFFKGEFPEDEKYFCAHGEWRKTQDQPCASAQDYFPEE